MPRTRRIAPWILASALALVGCGSSAESNDKRPLILTTFTVLADIAANVAGDHLRVESLTKVGAEIHGYEPTPGDIRKAAKADLMVDHGLNLEAWFEKFVSRIDVPHVVVSEGIETIPITDDADKDLPNPHTWMSPLNAQIYVDNLVEAFSELDPEHAEEFAANGAAYQTELQKLHDQLNHQLRALPAGQRALVTCEGAFSYLARDAGLSEKYLWAVNAERQATPQQIASTIEFVRANKVPAVFCESTVSAAPMKRVVDASDSVFGGTLYVDSLSAPDGPVPTYLDLLRHDVRVIVDALTGAAS